MIARIYLNIIWFQIPEQKNEIEQQNWSSIIIEKIALVSK